MFRIDYSRIPVILYIAVICILFYLWNWGAPMIMDDYWTNFLFIRQEDGSILHTTELIKSWSDFFETYYLHRFYHFHGRFSDVVGGFVLFLGGKALFNYLNTLVFLIFLLLASRIISRKATLYSISLVIIAAYLLLSKIHGATLWLMAACGYLWGATLYLLFLTLTKNIFEGEAVSRAKLIYSSLLGLICGLWHEGLALPLLATSGSIFLFRIYRDKRINWQIAALCCSIFLGLLLFLTSPSIWGRVATANDISFAKWAYGSITAMFIRYGRWAIVSVLIVGFLKHWKLTTAFNNIFLLFSGSMAILIGASECAGRAHYFFCLAALLCLLYNLPLISAKKQVITGFLAAAVCIYHLATLASTQVSYRHIFEDFIKQPADSSHCLVYQCDADHPAEAASWLPDSPHNAFYPYVGKYLGRDDIWAYTRKNNRDTAIYSVFDTSSSPNLPDMRKTDGSILIRIPCGKYDISGIRIISVPLKNGDSMKLLEKNAQWGIHRSFIARWKHEKLGAFEFDYADGYYYIILEDDDALHGCNLALPVRVQDGNQLINQILHFTL